MSARPLLAGLLLVLGLGTSAQAQERHVRVDDLRISGRIGPVQISYQGGARGYGVAASYDRHGRRGRYERHDDDDHGRRGRRSYGGSRGWVPGHYEVIQRRVWEPEHVERIWIEPIYETRCDFWGRTRRVLVRSGYWEEVCVPGRYVVRDVKVWRPGGYRYSR